MPLRLAMMYDGLFEHAMESLPGCAERFPSGGGVFLLTDDHDRLVQLGSAGDLRRALRSRLLDEEPQEPAGTDDERARAQQVEGDSATEPVRDTVAGAVSPGARKRRLKLSEVVRRIRWKPAYSQFEIDLEYYRIARELMPDRYLKQVGFGPAWFVRVDAAAAIPRFNVGKILRSPPGVDLGPFGTQADATRFVQILQDAFDLCRHEHILEQAPRGQACAYHEMGRCAAPCDGSVPMAQYRAEISAAIDFATGARAAWYREIEKTMRGAAAEQAYERAAVFKQRLERARGLDHPSFRFARPVDQFNFLIVQRGPGRTRVKAFHAHAGRIDSTPAVRLKDLGAAVPAWLEAIRIRESAADVDVTDQRRRSEQIALVTHYLFRRDPPGLFLPADTLRDAENVCALVHQRFQPQRSAAGEAGEVPRVED